MASKTDPETARLEKLKGLDVQIKTSKSQYRRIALNIANNSTSALSREEVTVNIQAIHKLQDQFTDIEMQGMAIVKAGDEETTYTSNFDNISSKLYNLLASVTNMKDKYDLQTKQQQKTRDEANAIPTHDLKLPKFTIPPFDGDPTMWSSFIDQFNATVHNNVQLAAVQKLQFLKSLMRGSALALINGFTLTGQNYTGAYDLLTERFSNPRQIVTAHFNRFFDIPVMTRENVNDLIKMADVTAEVVQSLKVLQVQVGDAILIHILVNKLDHSTRKEWEFSLKGDTAILELKTFNEFILQKIRALQTCTTKKPPSTPTPTKPNPQQSNTSAPRKCQFCEEAHAVWDCEKFKGMSIPERRDALMKKGKCLNCLASGHIISTCTRGTCKRCQKMHHTLLHSDSRPSGSNPKSNPSTNAVERPGQPEGDLPGCNVLLSTAVVNVEDSDGNQQNARLLLDPGSQVNLISEKFAKLLNLQRRNRSISIDGIGQSSLSTKGLVTIVITSQHNIHWSRQIDCYILPKLTSNQPHQVYNKTEWPQLKHLQLADENFHHPNPVDILLGCSIFNELILPGKVIGPPGTPHALQTELGWAVSGEASTKSRSVFCLTAAINFDLQRFWAQEEVPEEDKFSSEEEMCEQHFASTVSRRQDGTYQLKLPFRPHTKPLGNSKTQAISRFFHVERRLEKTQEIKTKYIEVMNEFISLKHMEKVPHSDRTKMVTNTFYLPHHSVVKESSTSTKLRVVFDGSAKSSTGISLNDKLMVGPTIQPTLNSTLLRFRFHPIALCADIKMMYRMIPVHPDDTDFLRVLWRDSPSKPIEEYRLTRVPFGLSSSPYLAIRTIQQLAHDEQQTYPMASHVIKKDLYVDDLLSGAGSVKEALHLQSELIAILKSGGFDLCKWSSNHPSLLASLPPEKRETDLPLEIESTSAIKTLGVQWNPATDDFNFTVKIPPESQHTKRSVLSFIAKLYDPLGWLQPTVVKSKLLMQELWRSKIKWDDLIPIEVRRQWESYLEQLPVLQKIKIPRIILPFHHISIELHGFSDASSKAYGAVVYMKVKLKNDAFKSLLLTSKSKVASIQSMTIPRLELMGALLLTKLMKFVEDAIKLHSLTVPFPTKHYWTDSMIVLHWIAAKSSKWKEFVSNRVSKIQGMAPVNTWKHVRTEENPADCISRGIYPSELEKHKLWWQGPAWLQDPSLYVKSSCTMDPDADLEIKSNPILFQSYCVAIQPSLINKYSSLTTLKRVTAYCYRFLLNFSLPRARRNLNPLSTSELHLAELHWVRKIQGDVFADEMMALRNNDLLPQRSRLHSPFPFIDGHGTLRVGGRIQNLIVNQDRKHPIILPSHHHFTEIVIRYFHQSNLHAGPTNTLAQIRGKYWILKGKMIVSRFINKCVTCHRFNSQAAEQLMEQLPTYRVKPCRPFLHTGVYYGGPVLLKIAGARRTRARPDVTYKAYVALFICLSTKAVHLEAVTGLTTEHFLALFRRFIARRGKPAMMVSDNGTNFEGADNELKRLHKLASSIKFNQQIADQLSRDGINWQFNPPLAPHHGGIWEAGIKSMKHHFKRIVGKTALTYEEFSTVLAQIESILNSRPLGSLSNNPEEFDPLTPGHFLIGSPLTSIPEPDVTAIKLNRLSQWQLIQQMVQHFWKRWSSDHLSSLQQRPKWQKSKSNIKVGDLALHIENNLLPLHWKLCRIVKVLPGADGKVRVVDIKTPDQKIYRLPIVKIIPLPFGEDDDSF